MTQDKDIIEFLEESNGIEGVYDAESLRQAIIAWEFLIKQEQLTLGVVLKTHKLLMLNQPIRPDEKGYLRSMDVFVGMRKMVPPHLISAFLDGWLRDMNAGARDWKELHVEYENYHPFVDGNGRTGRMFMNWYRIKKRGLKALVIYESEREIYYQWFK